MLLETFYEGWTDNLCTGVHKRILIYYDLWREFLLVHFSIGGCGGVGFKADCLTMDLGL